MNYKENLEIDIIDMCRNVMKHWKAVVVGAVVGAVAFGGYGYMKSGVTVDSETGEPYTGAVVSKYDSLKAAISEEDATLVEDSASQYLHYAKEYARELEYGKKSIALNIDARKTPKMTTAYAIDERVDKEGDESEQSIISYSADGELVVMSEVHNIVNACRLALKDDVVLEEIKNEAGIDVDNDVISELISVDLTGKSIMTVSVVGKDKAMCEAIIPGLEKKTEEIAVGLKEKYSFDISKLDTYYTVGFDSRIDSMLRDYNGYVYGIRNNMNGIASVLTPEQKEYYTALISNINSEVLGKSDAELNDISVLIPDEETQQKEVKTKVVRNFNVKYIAIGIVGGAFMVVLLFAVLYSVSGKLRISEDLRYAFGLSVISEVADADESKIDVINSEIGLAASNINASKLCIIGASKDESVSKFRDAITKGVKTKSGIVNCETCNDVINSISDMETMSGSDAVVLVEKKNCSRYENIAKELELCDKYGVKVLGAVVMG